MQDKFSKRQIIIHWLTLFLVIAAFYLGHELDEMDRLTQGAEKMALYPFHFWLGDIILWLTIARIYFIIKDGTPAALPGSALATKAALAVKGLLYLVLLALPISGIVMKSTSGLGAAIEAGDVSKLPDLESLTAHEAHAAIITILLVLVALHVLAALFHQVVLKDGIMDRISLRCKDGSCKKD